MRSKYYLVILSFICFFGLSTNSFSQDGKNLSKIFHYKFYKARVDLDIRASPPTGLLYRQGAVVGKLLKNQCSVFSGSQDDEKTIQTLLGDYKYLRVFPLDMEKKEILEPGWILFGESGQQSNLVETNASQTSDLNDLIKTFPQATVGQIKYLLLKQGKQG